jgi:hypothetical protein
MSHGVEAVPGLHQYCSMECSSDIELWTNSFNAGCWKSCDALSWSFGGQLQLLLLEICWIFG